MVRFRNPKFIFEIFHMLLSVMVKYSGGVTVQFQEEKLVLDKSFALKAVLVGLVVDIQLQ